jgi:hypothetical protein
LPLPPRGYDNSVSETDYLYLYIFMFKNLFGKKNDGFFMQMDESKPAAAKVESQTPEKTVEAVAPVQAAAVETPAEVPSAAAPAEIVATPEPTKATKTSVKDKKKKKGQEGTAAQPPEPVAIAAPVAAPTQAFTNFATDYLIKPSSNGSRRRPGANMKSFVTMAREVKVKK